MRRIVALVAGILAVAGYTSTAQTIKCSKASSTVEHLICGDRKLESADAAMGNAYVNILKATNDPEIRAMLVNSQKRWLKARDSSLGEVFDWIAENLDEKPGKAVVQRNLLAAIQDRTRALTARSSTGAKVPRLIEIALGQRVFAAKYTGGPFAGIDADCGFFPASNSDAGPYGYSCFATRSYQNKNRVCTMSEDWATYKTYEKYEIANVIDGNLQTIATCSIDAGQCPNSDHSPGNQSNWEMHRDAPPDAKHASPPSPTPPSKLQSSSRLDADAGPDEPAPWLHVCLTDPSYPPAVSTGKFSRKFD